MSKPSTSATVNSGNSLTTNLKAAFLLNEGTGTAKDYVTGTLTLTLAGGASWSTNGITLGATNARAAATTPAGLKLNLPITVYLRMIPTASTPSANVGFFGIVYDAAADSPFVSASCDSSSGGVYQGDGNTGGTFGSVSDGSTSITADSGATIDVALVMTTSGWSLYRNSALLADNAGAKSNPTYGATSLVGFGDLFQLTRNANCEVVFGYIFNADMSGDLATIRADPYALFSDGDSTPPTITARAIGTAGTTLVWTASEAITAGAGGSGGVTLSATNGAVTATYASGTGTTTVTYNLSRTIGHGETVTNTYVQPGDGWEDAAGNDLASFSGAAVTNGSNRPAAPTVLAVASVTASSVNLTWTDNADNETGFTVQYDTVNTFDQGPTDVTLNTGDAQSDSVLTLAASTTYYFRVKATNGNGSSDWSNIVSGTTTAESSGSPPPCARLSLSLGIGL